MVPFYTLVLLPRGNMAHFLLSSISQVSAHQATAGAAEVEQAEGAVLVFLSDA